MTLGVRGSRGGDSGYQGELSAGVHTPEAVIECLNEWGTRGLFRGAFRGKRIGERIQIVEVKEHPCHVVRLETQLERRSEETVFESYRRGPVDNVGTPPELWEIEVASPTEFVNEVHQRAIPHTERVATCQRCSGKGKVNCLDCGGGGWLSCSRCGGRGIIDQWGYNGRQYYYAGFSYCSCRNGSVECDRCNTSGKEQCKDCLGSGRLKFYQELTVTFVVDKRRAVAEVPEELIRVVDRVRGPAVYARDEGQITELKDLESQFSAHGRQLLKEAKSQSGRILRQRLTVESIPVTEVRYKKRPEDERERSLWIYGQEQEVKGDWVLLTGWRAVFGVIAGAAAAAAVCYATWGGGTAPEAEVIADPPPPATEEVQPGGEQQAESEPPPQSETEAPPEGDGEQSQPGDTATEAPPENRTGEEESQSPSGTPEEPGVTPEPEPPPDPVPPPAVTALGEQCREFGRIASGVHAFLVDFRTNIGAKVAEAGGGATIPEKRAAIETFIGFLTSAISSLSETETALRGMAITDERLHVIRARYRGAVAEAENLLEGLREGLSQQLRASDEEWIQVGASVAPRVQAVIEGSEFVQNESWQMMRDATNYCDGK